MTDLEIAIERMTNLIIRKQELMPPAFLGDLSLLLVAAKDSIKTKSHADRMHEICILKLIEKAIDQQYPNSNLDVSGPVTKDYLDIEHDNGTLWRVKVEYHGTL